MTGTFSSPVVLADNKNITGIRELNAKQNGDYEVYTVQGYLLFRGKNNADQLKSLTPGIYIINGTKFVKK